MNESFENLPEELRSKIALYKSQCKASGDAWSNRSGSIADNAARVRVSDRMAEEAARMFDEIEAYCQKHELNLNKVRQLADF